MMKNVWLLWMFTFLCGNVVFSNNTESFEEMKEEKGYQASSFIGVSEFLPSEQQGGGLALTLQGTFFKRLLDLGKAQTIRGEKDDQGNADCVAVIVDEKEESKKGNGLDNAPLMEESAALSFNASTHRAYTSSSAFLCCIKIGVPLLVFLSLAITYWVCG